MVAFKSDKVRRFFEQYNTATYPKGKIIFSPGDQVDECFVILKGRVRAFAHSQKGNKVILRTFNEGMFFPTSALINDTPIQHYYQAASEVELASAPRKAVLDFIQKDAQLLLSLFGQTHLGLEDNMQKMNRLMAGTAQDRLVYELITELRHNGYLNALGAYEIAVSEAELGERAGMTRETVSKEIRKLKQEKMVETGRGTITLLDVLALEDRLRRFV